MLPISSVVSKEMLPLVDKPVIQYVIEELVEAGVTEIVIVVTETKSDIVRYLRNPDPKLLAYLESAGGHKSETAANLRRISQLANFTFIHERPNAYGTGAPVLDAAAYLNGQPFIYTFGDDFFSGTGNSYRQLIDVYQRFQRPVLACLRRDDPEDYKRYGYAGGNIVDTGVTEVTAIVEQPGSPEVAPGNLASIGGFVLTPDIHGYLLSELAELQPGHEFQFNAALKRMLADGKQVYAKEIESCQYFDTGNTLEYMKTAVHVAARHSEIGTEFRQFLKEFTHKEIQP